MAELPFALMVGRDSTTLERLRAGLGERLALRRVDTVLEAVTAWDEGQPELVIIDTAGHSEATALGLVEHLRTPPSTEAIIVLVGASNRVKAFEAGVDECFDAEPLGEVWAKLARHLNRLRQLREGAREMERLRALSLTDSLTKLANHRAFHERLHDEFRRAQRYDDPLSLIMVDLDHFKSVNDTFGHPVGDAVLAGCAEALKRAVRETDFVARYGGEEFAVVLPQTHLAGALTVAERVAVEVRRVRVPNGPPGITASFGVSSFPSRSVVGPEQLLRTADEALYRSKREGRNKISLFQVAPFAS